MIIDNEELELEGVEAQKETGKTPDNFLTSEEQAYMTKSLALADSYLASVTEKKIVNLNEFPDNIQQALRYYVAGFASDFYTLEATYRDRGIPKSIIDEILPKSMYDTDILTDASLLHVKDECMRIGRSNDQISNEQLSYLQYLAAAIATAAPLLKYKDYQDEAGASIKSEVRNYNQHKDTFPLRNAA